MQQDAHEAPIKLFRIMHSFWTLSMSRSFMQTYKWHDIIIIIIIMIIIII